MIRANGAVVMVKTSEGIALGSGFDNNYRYLCANDCNLV